MSDIELVCKRKEIQDMVNNAVPDVPKQLLQQYLDRVIEEMTRRNKENTTNEKENN